MTPSLLPQIEISFPHAPLSIDTFMRQKTLTASSQHHFSKVNSISLTSEEQSLCEGPVTQKECFEALKNRNKTPGTDGLPAEFYKAFWRDISCFLISALNYGFDSGHLSVT